MKRVLTRCLAPAVLLLTADFVSGGKLSDPLFLLGAALFFAGGVVQVVRAGVFDGFIRSFKSFRRQSSKVEAYVSGMTDAEEVSGPAKETDAFRLAVILGGLLICGTGFNGIYLY
ncbi:DUF3899 domain-containing protein [Bhargavaea cecembensis]|uniref:DUF3899 domain-containing protein n=1 Tax=Bhargavaea cecembensis TaxID=394098 RepID=UPI00058F6C84|nr:DUF3899 domain-containing protein [Bhargavaea cecembensis]